MDYKKTIFLPITKFPMKGNLHLTEKNILTYWRQINLNQLIKEKKTSKQFLFHYGPPFANNNLHLGHALNAMLKDIIARFFIMIDYSVPILQGHDCHGYPIEIEIQKQLDNKETYSIEKIRKMCRAYAFKWSKIHKIQTQELGVLTNLKNTEINIEENNLDLNFFDEEFYSTMDKKVELKTYELFSDLLLDNKVYLKKKPIFWSIKEKSTIAEIDMVYKNKISTSLYIKLKIVETNLPELENSYIIFWTTTPWTIISNLAVAVNQDIIYVPIYLNGYKCYVAKNLEIYFLKEWADLQGAEEFPMEVEIPGKDFISSKVEHPIIENKIVPIILSDHVKDKEGTGFVHIAPDHGEEDFLLGQKYNLGLCDYVDESGYYKEDTPYLSGIHIFKNEIEIINLLNNKILSKREIEHSYPFSERTNTPLIYLCIEQIFINIKKYKKEILAAIEKVEWLPDKSKNRIIAFVENREDWCVSRQRIWGNPLLVFAHVETGELLKDVSLQKLICKEIEKNGTDHLFEFDWIVFLPENLRKLYRPIYGILDCWLDSGATFFTIIQDRFNTNISDLYLEGSDQHRGWFQSSLNLSILKNQQIPYRKVITHGFVVDEKGCKISKSKGNGIDLKVLLQQQGVDPLRIWAALSNLDKDRRFGKDIFEKNIDIYRKIRNVLRYLIGNIYNLTEEEENFEIKNTYILESYILHKSYLLQIEIEEKMKNFEIKESFEEIFKFIQDLSNFYLDIRKDIIYCSSFSDNERKAVRKTQFLLLEFLLRILNPFLPFLVEEIAIELNRNSYQLKNIYLFNQDYLCEENFILINNLREKIIPIKIEIEKARNNKIINSNNEIKLTCYFSDLQEKNLLETILMVGEIIFEENNIIQIEKTNKKKCDRCWKHNIISNISNENLCDRCKKCL